MKTCRFFYALCGCLSVVYLVMVIQSPEQLTSAWHHMRPHVVQQALWNCTKRFAVVPAGRGSGKTEIAKRKLVKALVCRRPWKDPRFFYGAPTHDQARMIAWDHLKALMPEDWITDINESDSTIRTVFGTELRVVGMDKPQRIEGIQWDGCVLDESCDLKPGVFTRNVTPMLTHRNGWCWRIGVPKRTGPSAREYRKFFEDAIAGKEPDAAGFTWPSSDILSQEQLAFAQRLLPLKDYREQFDAQFQTAGGGIYYAFDEKNARPCSYHPELEIIVGSDFNVDPMAWALGHRVGDTLEWFDEIFVRDANTPEVLTMLWARYSKHKAGFFFIGDATAQSRSTSAKRTDYDLIQGDVRFRRAGSKVDYPSKNPATADRYACVNAMWKNAEGKHRMFVDPKCTRIIEDMQSCSYRPGSREPETGEDLTHMSDAVGYVVHMLFPIDVPLNFTTPVVHMTVPT